MENNLTEIQNLIKKAQTPLGNPIIDYLMKQYKLSKNNIMENSSTDFYTLNKDIQIPFEEVCEITGIRKSVLEFAIAMEATLKENDYKGGWKDMAPEELFELLTQEYEELIQAMFKVSKKTDGRIKNRNIVKECIDLSNFSMMIAENVWRDYRKKIAKKIISSDNRLD